MPQRRTMASLAAALVGACAHAPGGAPAEDAIAEIMRLDAAGGVAAARRDAAGTLANYGDDIVYCGSRGAALGQEGIAEAWKTWFSADGPLVTWAPSGSGVATSGDLGWSSGRSRAEIKDAEGRPKVLSGEYVTVWSKVPGGWKGTLDLAVSRPAAEFGPGERSEVREVRSAAGDVEAVMGLWRRTGGKGPRAGAYLTVRRKGASGAWEVVEDRISPFTGEAPPGELVLLDAAWSLARGDAQAFRTLVAEDAVFAGRTLRRGREEVSWARLDFAPAARARRRPTRPTPGTTPSTSTPGWTSTQCARCSGAVRWRRAGRFTGRG